MRSMLLDPERHQRALVEDGWVGCVLHDMERDFDRLDAERTGVLRLVLGPDVMLTARHHPLRSADIAKAHILLDGVRVDGGAAALDLIITAIIENIAAVSRDHAAQVETFEDALLDRPEGFDHRRLIGIRRRVVQFHRLLAGMRAAFRRLEQDRDLPPELLATIEKLAQQLGGIDADMLSINGQLRLLREEADLQATQRTNQNLYVLSILSALLLPATLVTGFFGMNTGGLPFAHSTGGTFLALGLAVVSSLGVYALLRRLGLHKT
jgi:zinc transporter